LCAISLHEVKATFSSKKQLGFGTTIHRATWKSKVRGHRKHVFLCLCVFGGEGGEVKESLCPPQGEQLVFTNIEVERLGGSPSS